MSRQSDKDYRFPFYIMEEGDWFFTEASINVIYSRARAIGASIQVSGCNKKIKRVTLLKAPPPPVEVDKREVVYHVVHKNDNKHMDKE